MKPTHVRTCQQIDNETFPISHFTAIKILHPKKEQQIYRCIFQAIIVPYPTAARLWKRCAYCGVYAVYIRDNAKQMCIA